MASSTRPGMNQDQIKDVVRRKLNGDSIKLWLAPYTDQDGHCSGAQEMEELVTRYSSELCVPPQIISSTLEQLRQHAVDKLAARQKFQKDGIASLKIKLTGCIPASASQTEVTLETKLDVTSATLKQMISKETGIDSKFLKLISCGQVLEDARLLQELGLGQSSQVMVICLSECEAEARRLDDQRNQLERTKEAAKLLANREAEESRSDQYTLTIADHTGKRVNLPKEERQALSVALTLNEKGRACLKRKQYGDALFILLEADQAFRQCRSEILQAVDNYAVLCLDIGWCYLNLQHVDQLPDAESRLKTCEDCFQRSYGANMERLTALKGDSSRELALYVRLYLLQGIVAVLNNKITLGKDLLQKAEGILNSLQVDGTKLMQLVSMGYDVSEARLGLRAASGDVSHAITKILERRDRRKAIADKEKEERSKRKRQRKIGKTADGSWVNLEVFDQMVGMGFGAGTVGEALRQTNSDLHEALRVIREHPELLSLVDPEDEPMWDGPITDHMISQVTELGYSVELGKEAIRRARGVVEAAIDLLVSTGGVLPPRSTAARGSSSGTAQGGSQEDLTADQRRAIEEVIPDIPEHEEDYLDLTLDEEAAFIAEYKARIASVL